jgi:hypothetical protein
MLIDAQTVHRRALRTWAAVGVAYAALLVLAPLPVQAQAGPRLGSYPPGPDATGNNTYIGRLESPSRRVRTGADALVSGWFVDTTASGWAGADRGEVWLGQMGQGTKLSDLTVGQPRADVRDAFGVADWANSGYSASIPASTFGQIGGGDQTFNVYLHTPDKGWWFKGASVTIPTTVGLQFPNDPVVFFVQPQAEEPISQFGQSNSKFSLRVIALDRNVLNVKTEDGTVTDPTAAAGTEGVGVDRVQVYLDGPRCSGALPLAPPLAPNCGMFLGQSSGGATLLVNNLTGPPNKREEGAGPQVAGGTSGNLSFIANGFGPQFALAGFSISTNPTTLPTGRHTLWAYARSTVQCSGGPAGSSACRENIAMTTWILEDLRSNT